MINSIRITSEIGKLRSVLLHRPGKEIENLTPDTLSHFLFEDIPYLPMAQKEHDGFARVLQDRGIETLYLEEYMADVLDSKELQNQFVSDLIKESNIKSTFIRDALKEYLLSLSPKEMVDEMMAGVRKSSIQVPQAKNHLYEMIENKHPFYIDPMPNLFFTRDPAAIIGSGISFNRMSHSARRRESLFIEYIMTHHPRFSQQNFPIWFNRHSLNPLEGGDQLVLSKHVVAIGISERTSPEAIEEISINLFEKQDDITKVLAIEIPKKRAFMHLDTVFTMVDYDKFTIHPEIQKSNHPFNIYIIEKSNKKNEVKITHSHDLFKTLKESLNLSEVALIPCGGNDPIASAREQWSDGSNTLAIAPGVVVTYNRNYVTNDLFRSYGLDVIEIESAELSRGRGGPRCMSMPILRDDIN